MQAVQVLTATLNKTQRSPEAHKFSKNLRATFNDLTLFWPFLFSACELTYFRMLGGKKPALIMQQILGLIV